MGTRTLVLCTRDRYREVGGRWRTEIGWGKRRKDDGEEKVWW